MLDSLIFIDSFNNRIVTAPSIDPNQLVLYRDPYSNQYTIRLLGIDDELRFAPGTIQEIQFGDGTVWDQFAIDQAVWQTQLQQGTSGNDWLWGTEGQDVLLGGAGDDQLVGNGGNDVLDGGTGNDKLDGGAGADTYVLAAGGGSDTVMDGGAYWMEQNRIVTAPTIDPGQVMLVREPGGYDQYGQWTGDQYVLRLLGSHDELRFNPGTIQEIQFGDGTVWDQFAIDQAVWQTQLQQGTSGNDWLWGTEGQDVLLGGAGDDQLVGNGGDDVLDGGTGNDKLDGGAGADTYVLAAGGGSDTVVDTYAYWMEQNRIVTAPTIDPGQVMLVREPGGYDQYGQWTGDQYVLRLLGSHDELRFNPGTIQEIQFGDGTVWDQFAIDQAVWQTQLQQGTSGNDWLGGTEGQDVLLGGAGDDQLQGNGGNDVLDGGTGNDKLDGGAGSDTYVLAAGGGSDTVVDSYWMEQNRIVTAPTVDPSKVMLVREPGGYDQYGQWTGDQYVLRLLGSHDELRFNPGTIQEIQFGDGTVWDQFAMDQAVWQTQLQQGTSGNDWLGGTEGQDVLLGGAGDDQLLGNGGNDVLDGGTGNDHLDGGAGSDTYVLAAGGGSDTVVDTYAYWMEQNRIVTAPTVDPSKVMLVREPGGYDQYGQWTGDQYVLRLLGSHDELRFNPGTIQEIQFGDGTVWNQFAIDQAVWQTQLQQGSADNDWLWGTEGQDVLLGGAGDDQLLGNGGNDVLDGGTGNDHLDGGAGSDTYVLAAGGDSDTIVDTYAYWMEQNRIVTAPTVDPSKVMLVREPGGYDQYGQWTGDQYVLRLLGSHDELRFYPGTIQEIQFGDGTVWDQFAIDQAVWQTQLQQGSSGNDWLGGTEGQDVLLGGAGDDQLLGNGGNDVLDGGTGNDKLDGGAGSDTYVLAAGGGSDTVVDTYAYWMEQNRIVTAPTVDPSKVMLVREPGGYDQYGQWTGDQYVLRLLGSHDELRFNPGTIQEIQFGDGTVWNQFAIDQAVWQTQLQQGSADSDWLWGTEGQDVLLGGAGDDQLLGNGGNDVLDGGTGNDHLDGGAGSDTYVLAAGGGSDTIVDTYAYWMEQNRIVTAPTVDPSKVILVREPGGYDQYGQWTGDQYVLRLLGSHDELRFAPGTIQEIQFGDGTVWDQFAIDQAVWQTQLQQGTSGNDWLWGTEGQDVLLGGAGDDELQGSGGNDVLDGGAGNDKLDGGAGADTYVLAAGGGADTIVDAYASWMEQNRIVTAPDVDPDQVTLLYRPGSYDPYMGGAQPEQYVLRIVGSTDELRFAPGAIQEIQFGDGTVWNAQMISMMAVTDVNDPPNGEVTISGAPVQGETLVASNTLTDADGMSEVHYQWHADGVAIDGAIEDTYTLSQGDVGKTITVTASYMDGFGTQVSVVGFAMAPVANLNDLPSGEVLVMGEPVQGQTLTAIHNLADADGLGALGYQWSVDGAAVAGANESSYTLKQGDVGKSVAVTVSYVDGFGAAESVASAPTVPVENINDLPTGEVTIDGVVMQGQILTATSSLADEDGIGLLRYQWSVDGAAISGATESSYMLAASDVGRSISVTASYVDGFGTTESVNSLATAPVLPIPNLTLTGAGGNDTLYGDGGHDSLTGLGGSDTLYGLDGNDMLDGGAGTDNLLGGEGSDLYVINLASDHLAAEISDTGMTGTDEVRFASASASTLKLYASDTGVEKIVAGTGSGATANTSGTTALNVDASAVLNGLTLIGNAGANTLTGTAYSDTLDGGAGGDRLTGGYGDDTYVVDNIKDVVSEGSVSGGSDTVVSSIAYTLGTNVENLVLTGQSGLSGTGNSLANRLSGSDGADTLKGLAGNDVLLGGAGNDVLIGGLGMDELTGGAGADVFRFESTLGSTNIDTITDFDGTSDTIQLENLVFKKLAATGSLAAANFVASATGEAADANDYVLYNTSTGGLYYDADGNGAGAAVQVVTLTGAPTLGAGDFIVT
ncbi:calcium-binding protein [Aromatoleum toluolicum]|uniref:Hemolysin n=1 Tax=Aromatoleum toluolicum TaxID=90060 RepID=A0ABX1NKV1_9RHOO|nr:calcium-binding protein [Aromatoleum toluolicum]NMF99743.1 hemolysin [Aromatoleum toluolicum]